MAGLFGALACAGAMIYATTATCRAARHQPVRASAVWAGPYAAEAAAAASAVQRSIELCTALAGEMRMTVADPTGGKTMAAADVTSGVALLKGGDSTPVTAADFAIQVPSSCGLGRVRLGRARA